MYSTRINKEGKTIPSVLDPYEQYRRTSTGYEEALRGRSHPYASCDERYDGIMGCPSQEDEDWIAENNRRRQAASVLAAITSLGKPASVPALFSKSHEIRNTQRVHNQEELDLFLVQFNQFAVGDFITFGNFPSMGSMVGWTTISCILTCDRLIEEVVWPDKENVPKPFLALDLTPLLPNNPCLPSARYMNCLYTRHITADENQRYVRDNVQLQNYIKQAKESLKAGTLAIRG